MYPCNSSAAKFLHSQPSKRVSKTRHTRTSNTSEALFNAPMGIDLYSLKGISGGWSLAAKPCDTCKATAAAVFCRLDSAFLCLDCDSKIHNSINKHPRVWMCAVCEQAPAAVTCKADAAALCVSCDNDIHSANPLSRRHERLPVEPFFDSAETIFVKSSALNFVVPSDQHGGSELTGESQQDGVDSASWMIPNPKLGVETATALKTGEFLFADPFIALNHVDYPNSFQNHQMAGMDSLVPVQITKTEPLLAPAPIPFVINENCFDIEFCRSKLSSNNGYQNQSVSSSSLDVGVVPDGNSMPDISYAFGRNICTGPAGTDRNITVPASGGSQGSASQLCGIDREARVSRYREKRRNRKFEKTIRYQSRKAYAETRPRIKGRFAKRTDAHSNVDRLYNSAASAVGAYLADFQYGVVPSFADWVGNSVS